MKITEYTANRNNYGNKRDLSVIKYIAIHYTGNDGDTAKNNAKYYASTVVKTSAHYFVDDDSIYHSVPDDYVAWSVGGKKWSDCASTGGGKLHGIAKNANTLNVEMCDTIRDGKIMATDATLTNTVWLVRMLMDKYDIDIDHVIRHFDVTGKHCPAYFMEESAWEAFKARISPVGEPVSIETLYDVKLPAVKFGATGSEVKALQTLLNLHGAKLVVDGSFGPATKDALLAFQVTHSLEADGICGPLTFAALIRG